MDFLRQALAAAGGRAACLATVIRTSGSTPRHASAKMLIFADGTTFGTIGGGRVELEVTRVGVEIAGGGAPRRVTHHLVRDLAMCCGGSMELYLEPLGDCSAVLADAAGAYSQRLAMDLVTDMAVHQKRLQAPQHHGLSPALEGDHFVEPIRPRERAVLFGLGHVCRALGPLLHASHFEVIVCDDNETGALDHEIAWASRLIPSFRASEVETELAGLGSGDFAVILTRDHSIDQRIVEELLPRTELTYLGLIGSHGKVGRFKKRLVSKGSFDPGQWQRLHAPIGLDIAAETPEEIAVSIAAEMIAVKNGARRGRE